MRKGRLAIVLHAHLPFVRHPEYDSFLEERWFFEALTETYIPLLRMLEKLRAAKVPCQLNISISPTLLSMMADSLLQDRYARHINLLVELAKKEMSRHAQNGHLRWLAECYHKLFTQTSEEFDTWGRQVHHAYRDLHHQGMVELMTSSATHGILPLLSARPRAVTAQLRTGLDAFEDLMGFRPQGLWLPECATCPGLDKVLHDEGVRWFVCESHAIDHASSNPAYGVHAPLWTPAGVAAFGRDQSCSKEVWSAREGFPGDGDYREFYRDIGHDAPLEYIRPYIAGDVRVDTGIKYHRITGHTAHKEPYDFVKAREKAAQHAGHFVHRRTGQLRHLLGTMDTTPVVVAPFDAELFGHWWFEGPQWLDYVIRKSAHDQDAYELCSLGRYLDDNPVQQVAEPATSTWGHKGYFEIWLNGKNDWILEQLHQACQRMESLSTAHHKTRTQLTQRALNQCMRELLLAQSSDWPFIISGGTAEEYARRRVRDHIARFHHLADHIEAGTADARLVSSLEEIDRIFPRADYRIYANP